MKLDRQGRLTLFATSLLALLLLAYGAMSFYLFQARKAFQNPSRFTRSGYVKSQSLKPEGYLATGTRAGSPTGQGRGWVVRYASVGCEFCRQDEGLWAGLAAASKDANRAVLVVTPGIRDEYKPNARDLLGATEISLVDVAWIKHFRLSTTPTVLVFDSNGILQWAHQGVLARSDVEDAESIIGKRSF